MKIKTIKNAKNIEGKTVFLRADFNTVVKDGKIIDDFKIVSGLETIRFLCRYGCKVVIGTHFKNTKKDQKNMFAREESTTKVVANRLQELLNRKILFINDIIGLDVENTIAKMKNKEILVLGDLRMYAGEEKNDPEHAKKLASLADIYVNNSFAVDHRNHASVSAIKKFLPYYAGFLVEKEVKNLNKILNPKKPLIAIIGGAKVKTKAELIKSMAKTADKVLLGGALANNFIKARGFEVGKSLIDDDSFEIAKTIKNKNVLLPVDTAIMDEETGKIEIKNVSEIRKGDMILDIGPKTIELYSHHIKTAKTIIWNGPMGRFENDYFKDGTIRIAKSIAEKTKEGAFSVIGGGETIDGARKAKIINNISWVSTGGGALLTFLSKSRMPGLEKIVS